jgi:hypothetical protein
LLRLYASNGYGKRPCGGLYLSEKVKLRLRMTVK